MPQCVGIKNDGLRCSVRSAIEREHGGIRCAVHWRRVSDFINIHGVEDGLMQNHALEGRLVMAGPRFRQRAADIRAAQLIRAQANHNAWEGEPGEHARVAQMIAENDAAWAGRNARVPVGRLQGIANDNQNVHTREMVKQTKDIVKKVLAIPVPADYRWNIYTVSKTPGEIIFDCKLGINSTRIMIDKYTLSDDIYEMGGGIYGKVLDGIWQYIKNSKDKHDLCKILAQELKENIGMCLQGNLSRLCNVLAGYMDGIGPQESLAEILGREFAIISKLEDENEKIIKANKILDDNKVTDPEVRQEWISAL